MVTRVILLKNILITHSFFFFLFLKHICDSSEWEYAFFQILMAEFR